MAIWGKSNSTAVPQSKAHVLLDSHGKNTLVYNPNHTLINHKIVINWKHHYISVVRVPWVKFQASISKQTNLLSSSKIFHSRAKYYLWINSGPWIWRL